MISVRKAVAGSVVLAAACLAGCSTDPVTVARVGGTTMGTTYQVTYAPAGGDAPEAIRDAVDSLLEEINLSLSTYIAQSLISVINDTSDTGTWNPADAHLETVFLRSREIYEDTGGAFNPAVGPLVNAWGFGPDGPQSAPDRAAIASLLELVDFEAFQWRPSPPAIRKTIAGARLDFSAIAKGYGVDQVGALLEARGVDSYFVEIGGEVRTRGSHPEGRPWKVGIERPDAGGGLQAVLELNDSALATSGDYRNFTVDNGQKIVHILNPRTGYPETTGLLSASVIAEDVMTADAYATAFMVMGMESAMSFVEARPGIDGYFIEGARDGAYIERRSSGFPLPTEGSTR